MAATFLRTPQLGLCLNRTNGKDSRVRLRTNFLSITCCAIKGKEIRWFVTNCHLAQLVGLSYAGLLVLEFGSSNIRKVLFFLLLSFFPEFLFLVLGLVLGLGLGLGFESSSLIVRELVLSLTRLPFPLVRFRHNPQLVVNYFLVFYYLAFSFHRLKICNHGLRHTVLGLFLFLPLPYGICYH